MEKRNVARAKKGREKMKRRILLLFAAVAICMVPVAWAAEELDEKMPVVDWNEKYVPLKVSAKKARAEGDFLGAAPLFLDAGNASAFTYIRSLHKLNEGYCYLREADDVKSKALTEKSIAAYEEGLVLMDKADKICKLDCVHETNCTDTRRIVRTKLERSLQTALKFLAVLNK